MSSQQPRPTIEQRVSQQLLPPPFQVHIEQISIVDYWRYPCNLPLSYKQVRDALYRLRARGEPIRHNGRGWYEIEG